MSQLSYGIEYNPNAAPSEEGVLSLNDLKIKGIKYVRLQWLDIANVMRGRIIPTAYFTKVAESSRPCLVLPRGGVVGVVGGRGFAPGFSPTGEWLAIIDMSTLRAIPYMPDHASAFARFELQEPDPETGLLGANLCPRTLLARVVEKAKKDHGLSFLVGFETEFMLLKSTSPIQAVDLPTGWSSIKTVTINETVQKFLQDIGDFVQQSGIEVQMIHAEGGQAQFEIVTGPLPPLQAADAIAIVRQVTYSIAAKYGIHATLAPRVFPDKAGSSSHAHISIHHDNPQPSKETPKLYAHEAGFLTGVLRNLPALQAFTLPIPASYDRVKDGILSGGTYICWGDGARDAPMRLCNAKNPKSRNFEFRALDQTANPYYALAALISSGLHGIANNTPLKEKDIGPLSDELQLAPYRFTEEQRQELGITERLSLTWEEAMQKAEGSEVFKKMLGEEGFKLWKSVTETNAKWLAISDEATVAQRLELLVQSY